MEQNREKTIEKRRKILAEFIGCNVNEIAFEDSCHDDDLYRYKGRFYRCSSLENHQYGNPWYPKHQWRDIKKHRCSVEYYLVRSERNRSWTIVVGGQDLYTWKEHLTSYKPKTAKQVRRLAEKYTSELICNCQGDYDPKVVFSTIEEHFWRLFGRWHDGKNCKFETNMEGN